MENKVFSFTQTNRPFDLASMKPFLQGFQIPDGGSIRFNKIKVMFGTYYKTIPSLVLRIKVMSQQGVVYYDRSIPIFSLEDNKFAEMDLGAMVEVSGTFFIEFLKVDLGRERIAVWLGDLENGGLLVDGKPTHHRVVMELVGEGDDGLVLYPTKEIEAPVA